MRVCPGVVTSHAAYKLEPDYAIRTQDEMMLTHYSHDSHESCNA